MAAPTRRDAARNRARLVEAARRVFASDGPDAPLEKVAADAGVSRTTLHRHFASREALASAVLEENVADLEARAAALADTDDGAVVLFHHTLDVQAALPSFALVTLSDSPALGELARRTAAAFEPLLARGRAAGVVHPGVTTRHLMLALPMAMSAFAVERRDDRDALGHEAQEILHRGLFTTPPGRPPTSPP
ncbi:helix-turn-helix domain-containing protein [Isoptericola sp. F-RaC21]|uniref:TetR/AcrR family transcriptional regulator n=1 Tax=Isoptericola sp. F-RaC21 TaxID=3141452 RepID=UPI00315BF3B3